MQEGFDFTGEQLKEEGLDLVEMNGADFVSLMREKAEQIARAKGTVTSDDLREVADRMHVIPHTSNVWGAIFRGRQWNAVDYTRSRRSSNHARRIIVWELAS